MRSQTDAQGVVGQRGWSLHPAPVRGRGAEQAGEAAVKKYVSILGAGFAGLELAAQLSESLRDEAPGHIARTINPTSSFGFSKAGRHAFGSVEPHTTYTAAGMRPRGRGLGIRQERVTSIDPHPRRVTTDAVSKSTSSPSQAAWTTTSPPPRASREGGYEYYSISAGAERLRDAHEGPPFVVNQP